MPEESFYIKANSMAIDFAISKLRALTDQDVNALIGYLTKLAGVRAEEFVVHYPPQREPVAPKPRHSKRTGKLLKPRKTRRYKRTGVLGGSITSVASEIAPFSWIAKVGTKITYAPYVVGLPNDDPGQAWFHQGNWTPIATDIQAHIRDIIKVLEDELGRRLLAAFGS